MKQILGYVTAYFLNVDRLQLACAVVFTGVAIYINYAFGLNNYIAQLPEAGEYAGWYAVFLLAFGFPYLLPSLAKKHHLRHKRFLFLLLLAPALFAWKMAADIRFPFSADPLLNTYWNQVVYWPFKLLVVGTALFLIWRLTRDNQPFYGMTSKNFRARPYLLMLLLMLPLIAAASTQPDFLAIYPKLKNISFLSGKDTGWYKLLYELSYGSDFISIELFFRGFLILAFARWVGKDAILPMACFYCTIHFGKPVGECISSFFGGIILGIVTFHTRAIWGGLMVHLGIAWLMELGGYIGHRFF